MPFGAPRWSSGMLSTDRTFTGQRAENFGLMDYNARFYDLYLNRFLSPDSIVPDPYNPLDWDRYAYARNNPIKYTDPTGHMVACDIDDWGCQRHDYPMPLPDMDEYTYETGLSDEDAETLNAVVEFVGPIVFEPLDWMMMYDDCSQGDCSPLMFLGLLPGVPGSAGKQVSKQVSKLYDIVRFKEKVPGLVGHHGLLDKWARVNIPRYNKENAPVVLLTPLQHIDTFKTFNTWRKEVTGSWVGTIDWKKVSPQAMQDLTVRMFNAAGVPQEVQGAYIHALMKYLYEEVQ